MEKANGSDNHGGSNHRRDLFGSHEPQRYNDAEQRYSRFVEERLEKLLKGELNLLPVLRRYHQDPNRLGVPLPGHGFETRSLRLPVVERIMTSILTFLQTDLPGGPVTQERIDRRLIERQLFPTRLPHVVIERVDSYESGSDDALQTEWVIKRLQNQHAANRIQRMLDIANISLGSLGIIRAGN